MRRTVMFLALLLAGATWAVAGEDPTVVDADHYSVVFENDEVRVLRITYGPGEKSVMHDHPNGVAVFLTDHRVKFTMPDGSSETVEAGAGEVGWAPGGPHLPENLGDEALEVILVELKADGGTEEGVSAESD